MIKWEIFSARVPAGTRIKQPDTPITASGTPSFFKGEEGILLENAPFRANEIACDASTLEYNDPNKLQKIVENHLWFQPFRHIGQMAHDARMLQYLIDGVWQSYAQVMGDEA